MNTHVNTFKDQKAYAEQASNVIAPAVNYLEDGNIVEYKQNYRPMTQDKTKAKVGDIVFFNNMFQSDGLEEAVTYADPKDPNVSIIVENETIYGIVTIPSSHTEDGSVRIVSVDFMSIGDAKQLYWGPYNDTVDMDTSDKIATIVPGTTTVSLSNNGYFPTNYHKINALNNNADILTSWDLYAVSNNKETMSPYSNFGKNSMFFNSDGVTAFGLNGLANTNAILEKSTLGNTGHEDPVNSANAGFYPAAEACSVYLSDDENVTGSVSEKYYLPSVAELAYFVARFEQIEQSRVLVGGESSTNKWLWSSSQYSSSGAWYLGLNLNVSFGYCGSDRKSSSGYVLAFVAF